MASSIGNFSKVAMNLTPAASGWAASWQGNIGTGTYQLPVTNENITSRYDLLTYNLLDGYASQRETEQVRIGVQGQLGGVLDYNNCGPILQAMFGQAPLTAASGAGAITLGACSGWFTFASGQSQEQYMQFIVDKQISRWYSTNMVVNSFEFSAGMGEEVKWTADLIGRNYLTTSTALTVTNALTSFNAVKMNEAEFRIAPVTSGALAAGHAVKINRFTISCNWNLTADIMGTKDSVHTDARYILNPMTDAARDVTLSIELPRYDSDTEFITWKAQDTRLQAELIFTDGSERLTFIFPQLKINDGFNAETNGRAHRVLSGTLKAFRNTDNTTTYAGIRFQNEFTIAVA